jgi:GntR family transcriptional regulator
VLSHSGFAVLVLFFGARVLVADETIVSVPAPPREAHLLGTDVGLPLLLLSRHSIGEDGQPVEYVRSVYRGDRYKFVARLQRPTPS